MKFIQGIINNYKNIKSIRETVKNDEVTIVENANNLEDLFSSLTQNTLYNKECVQGLVLKIETEKDEKTLFELKNNLSLFQTKNNEFIDIIKRSISVADNTKNYKQPKLIYSKNTLEHIQLTQKIGSKLSKLLITAEECKRTIEKHF